MLNEKMKVLQHAFFRKSMSMYIIILIFFFSVANATDNYVVTYDCNGHGQMYNAEQVKEKGVPLTLFPYSSPEADHFVFWGWSTDPNATEAEYWPGDSYTKDESVTLYAVWKDETDLGEITASTNYSYEAPTAYTNMWYSFTVSESGKYVITAKILSQGMNKVYWGANYTSFSFDGEKNSLVIELTKGTQYYMCLGAGGGMPLEFSMA